MNAQTHYTPMQLERYSFWWSEIRLVIAAVALFLGGVPVLRFLFPFPVFFGIVGLILTLAWLISGIAVVYLLYLWNKHGQKVFSGKKTSDVVAFFVMIVSGINLGLAGLSGRNIGISIFPVYGILVLVGLVYLWTAYYLYNRWKAHGEKIF